MYFYLQAYKWTVLIGWTSSETNDCQQTLNWWDEKIWKHFQNQVILLPFPTQEIWEKIKKTVDTVHLWLFFSKLLLYNSIEMWHWFLHVFLNKKTWIEKLSELLYLILLFLFLIGFPWIIVPYFVPNLPTALFWEILFPNYL